MVGGWVGGWVGGGVMGHARHYFACILLRSFICVSFSSRLSPEPTASVSLRTSCAPSHIPHPPSSIVHHSFSIFNSSPSILHPPSLLVPCPSIHRSTVHISRHMTYFRLPLSHANPLLTASNVKIAPTHTTRARTHTRTHTHTQNTYTHTHTTIRNKQAKRQAICAQV